MNNTKVLKNICIIAFCLKLTFLLVTYSVFFLLPFNKGAYLVNFRYPENQSVTVSTPLKTWDAEHYLYLAERGYKRNIESDRFFPLYPSLIHLVSLVLKNSLTSALIVSTIFSMGLYVYFYKFVVCLYRNEQIAFTSVLLLMVFPTAFFLSLPYSESLFLFMTVVFFYYLYKRKFLYADLLAFLLPFTRPVGILIIIPFIIFFLNDHLRRKESNNKPYLLRLKKEIFHSVCPLLGFMVFIGFMYVKTGNPLEAFTSAQLVVSKWHITNILRIDIFFGNLVNTNLVLHGFTNSIIDRVFFMFYLIALIFMYKRLDKTLFFYALSFGMVPLFGSFMSYTRYVLVVFPLFILLSLYVSQKQKIAYFYSTLFLFFSFQIVFLILHVLNYWVA